VLSPPADVRPGDDAGTPPVVAVVDGAAPARLRRVPQQDRGQRRVDLLLDAAAAVIAEAGVDAATTNAIAAARARRSARSTSSSPTRTPSSMRSPRATPRSSSSSRTG
jgi:hypothetical protein